MNKTHIFILFFIIIFLNFSCIKIKDYSVEYEDNNDLKNKKHKITDLQNQLHLISDKETSSVVSINTEKVILQKYYDLFDFFFRDPNGYLFEIQEFRNPAWPG